MKKGGLADSPFFRMPSPAEPQPTLSPPRATSSVKPEKHGTNRPTGKPAKSRKQKPQRATTTPRYHDTMLATTTPRYHDTIIEAVRKAVKEFGKEAATHRFTLEEKKAIADILYAYKRREVRTSENEVARIAINFIIQDYQENGENSVLHKALTALNT